MEYRFRVEKFTVVVDQQLEELNSWFIEQAIELLILSVDLNPKDGNKSLKIDDICSLVERYYPEDFYKQDQIRSSRSMHCNIMSWISQIIQSCWA